MSNKGFTLIELLATIIILSIILLIAVPSVSNLSETIRKNNRENKIKNIEIAAAKYAFDTGETLIFVDKLITEGYIDSDDGDIVDSLNNSRLNCYIVEMEKVNDYYTAKFIDDNMYEKDGKCDTSKLNEHNAAIFIEVLSDGKRIENTNNWIKGTVNLRVYSNTVIINCDVNSCIWTSSSGANINGKNEITIDNVSNLLETRYNFQMTVLNDDDNGVKRYNSNINLKIDNESPIIYENEIKVTNRYEYTSTKKVTIEASDGKGSGIEGYYLGLNTGSSCLNDDLEYQSSNTFTINSNGNYLICVKDKVGNISSNSSLNINFIR